MNHRDPATLARTVHVSENGMRLDRFVRIHAPDLPFGLLSSLLKRGRLTVDGRRARATDRLAAGAAVRIEAGVAASRTPPPAGDAGAAPGLSEADRALVADLILYRDDDILVLDKPAGLAVHAGTRTSRHLDGLLASFVAPGEAAPMLVHRLDKDTSGLIVAARRRDIAAALGRVFAGRAVEKDYRAVVVGVPEPREGRIDRPLVKRETPAGGRVVVAPDDPEAKPAASRWRVIEAAGDGGRALVALAPETGRQHQLRVHMAAVGHPILGDRLYAPPSAGAGADRLFLHAFRLAFRHPRGHDVQFEAPVPTAFRAALSGAGLSPPSAR